MYLLEEDLEWEKNWNLAINRLMRDPWAFQDFDDKLKKDIHIAILAIEMLTENYNFLDIELKNNHQMIFLVIEKNPEMFSSIDYKKQNDTDLINELCLLNPQVILQLLPSYFYKNNLNKLIQQFKDNQIMQEIYMSYLKKREIDFKDCSLKDFAW